MEVDSTPKNPDVQQLAPPQMPYPTQQLPPSYADVAPTPAYPQPYYPTQFAPGPQPVVYQPGQYAGPVITAPPVVVAGIQPTYNDYMCWSIVNLLFCLPFGLVALIFSCKTQEAVARQDLYSARSLSAAALRFNVFAMMNGIFAYIFLIIYLVIMRQFNTKPFH